MNTAARNHQGTLLASLLLTLSLTIAGCSSTPKVDWNSRIGSYTYDQAVLELGPPDKSTQLSDGSTVAEWIISSNGSGARIGFGVGSGSYGHGYGTATGVGVSAPVGSNQKARRLTFDSNGVLQQSELIK